MWTGEEVLYLGLDRGLRYDPSADQWSRLPTPPNQNLVWQVSASSTWAEDGLMVWGAGCANTIPVENPDELSCRPDDFGITYVPAPAKAT